MKRVKVLGFSQVEGLLHEARFDNGENVMFLADHRQEMPEAVGFSEDFMEAVEAEGMKFVGIITPDQNLYLFHISSAVVVEDECGSFTHAFFKKDAYENA